MKMKLLFFALALLFLPHNEVPAQESRNSVWAVDFVKTKAGRQADYLSFIERNWAKAREFMKNRGIVNSYRVLSLPPGEAAEWNVLLVTEYKNQAGYEKREDVFKQFSEYRKTQQAQPANSINPREISEIKFSRAFNEPVSSEIGMAMLSAQIDDAEKAAARVPLENYLKGHATGDPEFMRKAFHTEGKMIFLSSGKYTTRTFAEYINGMKGKPAPDEAQRKRWIESIEVTGNAAVGKIVLDYPSVRIVDYMTLLRINGEWKIVNKSFHDEPKTAATQK